MDNFTYYSITGKYKELNISKENPQDMLKYMEHFSEELDQVEDSLAMIYKKTDIKVLGKEDAKKLIDKYLQK
jgi:hypothetical protein